MTPHACLVPDGQPTWSSHARPQRKRQRPLPSPPHLSRPPPAHSCSLSPTPPSCWPAPHLFPLTDQESASQLRKQAQNWLITPTSESPRKWLGSSAPSPGSRLLTELGLICVGWGHEGGPAGEVMVGHFHRHLQPNSSGGSRDWAEAGTGLNLGDWGRQGSPLSCPRWCFTLVASAPGEQWGPPPLISEGSAGRVNSMLAPAGPDMLCDLGQAARRLCAWGG